MEFETVVSTDQIATLFGCQFQLLTAPGPGAVAVILLTSGKDQTAIWLRRKIASGSSTERPSAPDRGMHVGRIYYGRWNGEDLVIVRTSEGTFEIQCHGGRVAINRIREDLQDAGVTETRVGDEVHGSMIQQQIERKIERCLPAARSRKIAGLILAQTTNSLLDDLTVLNSAEGEIDSAKATRQRLERWQNVADHLSEPWQVVLAGAPNVGKSSLINTIAGMERSIVYDQPGTTRDIVEVDTVIDGWPFRLVDTAGIRQHGDTEQIEALGIQQSYLAASQCDVLCVVVDERPESQASIERLMPSNLPKHTVVVRNKCDLATDADTLLNGFSAFAALPRINVSAATGEGLAELLQWIKLAVVPEEPTKETAIPIVPI